MAATVPVLLGTLGGRLPRRSQRISVYVFLVVMTAYFAIVPVLAPLLGQYRLEGHPSVVDRQGVCRQTSEFSCGAAAAVTALGELGIRTDEATMAREALTGPAFGTDPVALTDAINRMFGGQGVHAEYRRIDGEQELIGHTPVIVEIHTGMLMNHYVTVLGVFPEASSPVVIGDPAGGLRKYPLGVLSQEWHGTGIFLMRAK
jgi:predicted double-glycine peptidase